MDILKNFFEQIIQLTFWQRLFSWKRIRNLTSDALEELHLIRQQMTELEKDKESSRSEISTLKQDIKRLEDLHGQTKESNNELKSDLKIVNERLDRINDENSELKVRIQEFESTEESRNKKHQTELDKMIQSRESFESDRTQLADERIAEKEAHFDKMKKQWSEHEAAVEINIRSLCEKNMINYIDKVPFKGRPDNTIEICGEFVIFDAKSPANDNYENFPKYIISQTEAAKKYVDLENVRKEIYLVIPSSTIEVIDQWTYYLGDYTVYVITRDALEPVILSLKRLEDYEFAEKLSPEDRETIVRIIAKFAHSTKRRIQVDQYFADQFLELLRRCERELPAELQEQVVDFEKREKMNPPIEKRARMIPTGELEEQQKKIDLEAQLRMQLPESQN